MGSQEVTWRGETTTGGRVVVGVFFGRLTTPEGTRTVKFVQLGR